MSILQNAMKAEGLPEDVGAAFGIPLLIVVVYLGIRGNMHIANNLVKKGYQLENADSPEVREWKEKWNL